MSENVELAVFLFSDPYIAVFGTRSDINILLEEVIINIMTELRLAQISVQKGRFKVSPKSPVWDKLESWMRTVGSKWSGRVYRCVCRHACACVHACICVYMSVHVHTCACVVRLGYDDDGDDGDDKAGD